MHFMLSARRFGGEKYKAEEEKNVQLASSDETL